MNGGDVDPAVVAAGIGDTLEVSKVDGLLEGGDVCVSCVWIDDLTRRRFYLGCGCSRIRRRVCTCLSRDLMLLLVLGRMLLEGWGEGLDEWLLVEEDRFPRSCCDGEDE